MRLTLVIYCLSGGGAERVMSIMSNYWAEKGLPITILTFVDSTVPPSYDLDDRIHQIPLGIAGNSANKIIGVWNNWKCIQTLRRAISESKPDAVVSFQEITNAISLLGTIGLNIPVVVSERNEPGKDHGIIWEQLRQWTNHLASRIVIQTDRAKIHVSPKLEKRVRIIPNPVLFPTTGKYISGKKLSKPALIAMGRLEPQKGFDVLLKAFAQLKDLYPEWTLTILGEGRLRSELEVLRDQLGLVNRVNLPGRVKNPYELLSQADIFVMPSRYEGFPNALCEAMACGIAVISTDCPCGPREIIRDSVDGILVLNEDVSALALGMKRLMDDEKERQSLAIRAPEVIERFSLDKVMAMWEAVIDEAIATT
jgi:GalNAc-alpha-(1->4)-GalNAc-alpha-(1->3)-diNAcBac-PP-undecaprenol alpha-1,4-N-acetyl-D-galactosaminyltransferase